MIVVDALRHDYITQSIMPETRKFINNSGLEFLNHYSGQMVLQMVCLVCFLVSPHHI